MKNSLLHLLTNRESNFGSSLFPASDSYVPHTEEGAEYKLRTFLKLREGDEPYYLVGIMSAVLSFPEIYEEFQEDVTNFSLKDYRKQETTVHGGTIENFGPVHAEVLYMPTVFPPSFTTQISYCDNVNVYLTRGTQQVTAAFGIRDDKLEIDWPANYGIKGLIGLNGTAWSTNTKVTITHEPDTYPYTACASMIEKNKEFFGFLNDLGLLKNFHSAQSSLEKIAIVGLAISNPAVYVS